jgi:hypothetical protein
MENAINIDISLNHGGKEVKSSPVGVPAENI